MVTESGKTLNKTNLIVLVILGLTFAFTMFAHAANEENKVRQEYVPQLKIENVIQMAKEYAIQKGMDLNEYFISTIKYEASTQQWYIFLKATCLLQDSISL